MNDMNFDPMTGEPLHNYDNLVDSQDMNTIDSQPENKDIQEHQTEKTIQDQLQNIATVEQSEDDFINKIQMQAKEMQDEENKEKNKFTFLIILFIVLLGSIYFLFPLLLKI